MRRIFFLIFLLFFAPLSLTAKTLEEKIQIVESRYQSISSLSADFTQKTFVQLLERDVVRKGKLSYQKEGKIRIEYFSPSPKVYVTNKEMLWMFIPGEPSSLLEQKMSDKVIPKEALSFLGGFGKLTKEFRVSPSKVFENRSAEAIALYLTPRSKKSPYTSLEALFTEGGLLEELVLNNRSGNRTLYHFSDITTNKKIEEELFSHP